MTTGQRLKQAREAQNISLDDVARRTNIRLLFLEAIESDDLALIPSSHQRLFVREFAKVLGMDPNEALADLPEVSPAVVAPEVAERGDAPFRSETAESDRREYREILNRLSQSGGQVSQAFRNPAFMLIGAATVLLLAVAVYYFIAGNDSPGDDTILAATDSTAGQTEILSSPEVDTSATATPAVDLAEGDSLTLEGRATARVWYTIVMDGKRSETGTLDSGAVKTWRAYEVFKVSLGNAGGLHLSLNERPLGALGPAQSVVRSKLIDKDGIRQSGAPARRPATTTTPVPATGSAPPRIVTARENRPVSVRRSTSRRSPARATRRAEPMKEILTTQIR
jgi:cytoskeleton protein RodZ